MAFQPSIVVSNNPINFINAHSLHQNSTRIKMHIDKVKWITAHNYGRPKCHHAALVQAEKGKFGVLTLSHKMCPRKQTTEPTW